MGKNYLKIFREHIKNIINRQKEKSITDFDSKRLEKNKPGTDILPKEELKKNQYSSDKRIFH